MCVVGEGGVTDPMTYIQGHKCEINVLWHKRKEDCSIHAYFIQVWRSHYIICINSVEFIKVAIFLFDNI